MNTKVIAVDFDGVLCENAYPQIGEARVEVMAHLMASILNGAKVILWTCRTGKLLAEAVDWCKRYGITFDAVNANLPERIEQYGSDSRKVSADEYWDDKAYRF